MSRACLIVAYDPWLLQLLRIYIEECGFRVVQVHDGQDVLPVVAKEDLAAILLQVDLPGKIKGKELLKVLHQDPQAHHIPVFAFSWQNEDLNELAQSTATNLQEPVTYDAFVDAFRKAGIQC
jgi:CheY-like chemotaxis protein